MTLAWFICKHLRVTYTEAIIMPIPRALAFIAAEREANGMDATESYHDRENKKHGN